MKDRFWLIIYVLILLFPVGVLAVYTIDDILRYLDLQRWLRKERRRREAERAR